MGFLVASSSLYGYDVTDTNDCDYLEALSDQVSFALTGNPFESYVAKAINASSGYELRSGTSAVTHKSVGEIIVSMFRADLISLN